MLIPPSTVPLRRGGSVELRSPTSNDAAAMLAFRRTLLHESSDNLNHFANGADHVTEAEQTEFLRQMADSPKAFIVSAFVDGAIAGNLGIHLEMAPRLAHVASIGMGVLQAYHGCGIGRALMQEAIRVAPTVGLWNLKLTVRTFNAPAIALYESCGFRRVGTLEAIAQVGDGYADEHVYQLVLRSGY